MTLASTKLTKVQAKALKFIRDSLESTGTSPTLRELCSYMEYSAIGSAQDLVAALRRKAFLHTPSKQTARSLVLTPKAIAITDPVDNQSTDSTFAINCYPWPETDRDLSSELKNPDRKIGCLRMSVNMLARPYPNSDSLFAIQTPDASLNHLNIIKDDWVIVQKQKTAAPGQLALGKTQDGCFSLWLVTTDVHLNQSEGATAESVSVESASEVVGRVIAVQRIMS